MDSSSAINHMYVIVRLQYRWRKEIENILSGETKREIKLPNAYTFTNGGDKVDHYH